MKLVGIALLSAAAAFAQSAPIIQTSSFPAGFPGVAYSASMTATGGTAPYSWSYSNGVLPPGLFITGSTISGTPTTAGTYTFLLTVIDVRQASNTRSLSITINNSSAQVTITTGSPLPPANVGLAYNTVLSASGGTPPYRWTATGVPAGLTLDTAGTLSGVATTVGTFNIAVQVTDAAQVTASRTLSLSVVTPPLTITTVSPLFTGTVGVPYAQTFTAIGGTRPYAWSLTGNAGGLTLDAASGVLSGTPQTAGTFSFTVQVTDSARGSASQNFSVVVNPPSLGITLAGQPVAGTVGVPYNQKLPVVANGGTPPITWSLAAGSVPGLTFEASTLTLSGTPTTPGNFDLTVQANDAAGLSARRVVTITIAPGALSITTGRQLPDVALNGAYEQTFTAIGGQPPYTWSATGLPAGLTMNSSTGVLSGTVTAAGNFGIAVTVTDAALRQASDRFTLNVTLPPAPPLTLTGLPSVVTPARQYTLDVTIGSAYPAAITGQALLTFSPESGLTDRTVVFANGTTTVNFTVPLGSTAIQFDSPLALQTGTVAGTITVTLRLQAGGIDITPSPAPALVAQLNRAAPVIRDAQFTRSGSTITFAITGYSTSREITQATFAFSAASGQTLQPSASSITVDVGAVFTTWYQSPNNTQYGSQFVYNQPFTITGDVNAVTPVSVTLVNREGSTVFRF